MRFNFFILILALCACTNFPLLAQDAQPVDSTIILEGVNVEAYGEATLPQEVDAAVQQVDAAAINTFSPRSPVHAFNQVPGVRMEERSPGSYRISIRGSALRSPFDVRNVKIYWNDIPFTEPGGNTPFNLLDINQMQNTTIIRGPAGSLYGGGNGGVLLINSVNADQQAGGQATVGYTTGSFGLQRGMAKYRYQNDQGQTFMIRGISHQEAGYRDHSSLQRNSIDASAFWPLSSHQSLSWHLLGTSLAYDIPGGLTKEQFDSDPTQARPGNDFAMGSIESQSGINVNAWTSGLTHEYFDDKLSWKTTVYAKLASFDNPFIFDYKSEAQQEIGIRSRLSQEFSLGQIPVTAITGIEYQNRFAAARNFGNNQGTTDTLNFDDEIITRQGFAFQQFQLNLNPKNRVTLAASANWLHYDIDRLWDYALDTSYQVTRDFGPIITPRIAYRYQWNKQLWNYAQLSYGYSPPTLEEFRTNEGSINTTLQPEQGINLEGGLKGRALNNQLYFDLVAYHYWLQDMIVDYPSDRGTDLFRNTGQAQNTGVEVYGRYELASLFPVVIQSFPLSASYNWQQFVFQEYESGGETFDNNKVPGIAPHTVTWQLAPQFKNGLFANINFNHTTQIPLDNANSVYSNAYTLLACQVGYELSVNNGWKLHLATGANNLLDEKYSLGNDLNAFGNRFYQPSPPRNYYVKVRVQMGHQ